jgi:hypothetical protein
VFLASVRLRSIFLNAGDYVGYSLFINPLPDSKYYMPQTRNYFDINDQVRAAVPRHGNRLRRQA